MLLPRVSSSEWWVGKKHSKSVPLESFDDLGNKVVCNAGLDVFSSIEGVFEVAKRFAEIGVLIVGQKLGNGRVDDGSERSRARFV